MKPPNYQKSRFALLMGFLTALLSLMAVTQFAQTQLPERKGYVSDFTGVVDEQTRQQLEVILENVKTKTGIEFDIAVVDSTAGQEMFDYSRQLASKWGVGARPGGKKSLLLVVSVNDKTSFTQFSRSVRADLPEGILGEMSQRMRSAVNAGQVGEALSTGVNHFVFELGKKLSIDPAEFGQNAQVAPVTIASGSTTVRPRPVETPAAVEAAPTPAESPAAVETASALSPKAATTPLITSSVESDTPKISSTMSEEDADESEEVELTLTLPLNQRVVKLKEFLRERPASKFRLRATEILVSARAGLGDDQLKRGDRSGGVEQFMSAIDEAPINSSEKLFSGVIAQIPLNLYLRGERAASTKAAQAIEAKFAADPKRLIAVSGFYAGTEQIDEAIRIATKVVESSPNLSEAHQALGRALHVSLRLDEAAAAYKRALELDPDSKAARRSLADLLRGLGKAEQALPLYREQLLVDPADKGARAGLILSLLDLRRIDEAKGLLDTALKSDQRNVVLLSGVAYWYAAHNNNEAALDMGMKAVEIEPRYTWAQVALARALIAQKRPQDAERALRFARLYGKFPTLDYELATALASAGLYDEAAELLLQSFRAKDNQIETRLAGRAAVQATDFIELLGPERRASIFQATAADSEVNAKNLKALLRLATLVHEQSTGEKVDEGKAVAAAKEFASGDDDARVHRQLYAASRLLKMGVGFKTVQELAENARSGIETGLNVPAVTLAVQADEFRDIRARAIASGGTPDIPEAPRNILSNLLRGRIEDITGWAFFNQDKLVEAVVHLKLAANTLPESTPAWRTSLWHLGTALEQSGKQEEALSAYIKSYNAGDPDLVRRAVIENVYRKVHGSLSGLEEKMGQSADATSAPSTRVDTTAPSTSQRVPAATSVVPDSSSARETVAPRIAESSPSPTPEETTEPAATVTPTPEPSPVPTPTPAPSAANSAASEIVGEPIPKARQTVSITGRVKDSNNGLLPNVVVVLISPQGTVLASTTDEQGVYRFTVAPSQLNYRIIPSKSGFTFQPVDKVLEGVTDDQKDLDFVGTAARAP